MKQTIFLLTTALLFICNTAFAQATLKEYKAGHAFNVSLPDYMMKTIGMNDASSFEYKSEVKDVYGFIIHDTKEDLALVDLHYTVINEFYDGFIVDFLKDEPKRKVSTPLVQKKGDITFLQSDVSYYDKEAKTEIYYLVGIVETKTTFYKVLSWCTAANKDTFKADFEKILYSIKD